MNILIVNQNQRTYNPTAISHSFLRAFEANNISCESYDLSYYINRYFNFFVKKNISLRKKIMYDANQKFIDYVVNGNYTHLFVVKGTYLLPETLVKIKKLCPVVQTCCFNPDDPFNPQTWGGSNHPNIKDTVPNYDYYFIWSKKLIPKIKALGVEETHYLPFAIDNQLIKSFNNILPKYDLSFIGNADTERQEWINRSADYIKKDDYLKQIDIFGIYWNKHPKLSLNGSRFGDDYFKVFYESKININILREQNKGETNMRTFEIPATGNFMLHEVSEGAKEFFKADRDAVYFSSPEELIDKSNFYLKNESLRIKIAHSGYQKTLNYGYTYEDRVSTILKKLSNK